MTTVRADRWAGSTALAALLLGVLAAVLAGTPVHARIVPVDMSFSQLLPGEERSSSAAVSVPRDARLADVVVDEATDHPDSFIWDVNLCRPAGECLAVVPSSEGAELAAGAYALEVAVRLVAGAPAGASSMLAGHLVLVDADGELPLTGTSPGLLVVAVCLLGAGAVLVALARRRSWQEAPDA